MFGRPELRVVLDEELSRSAAVIAAQRLEEEALEREGGAPAGEANDSVSGSGSGSGSDFDDDGGGGRGSGTGEGRASALARERLESIRARAEHAGALAAAAARPAAVGMLTGFVGALGRAVGAGAGDSHHQHQPQPLDSSPSNNAASERGAFAVDLTVGLRQPSPPPSPSPPHAPPSPPPPGAALFRLAS